MIFLIGFAKKHWLILTIVVVGIVVALSFGVGALLSKAKGLFNKYFGNPSTDQSITGGDTFHTNVLDASLSTLAGGQKSNVPTDRTRTTELEGFFKAAEGDRSWADLTSDPGGTLKFLLTGNTDDLMN